MMGVVGASGAARTAAEGAEGGGATVSEAGEAIAMKPPALRWEWKAIGRVGPILARSWRRRGRPS